MQRFLTIAQRREPFAPLCRRRFAHWRGRRANPQYLSLPSTAGQFGQFVHIYGPRFFSFDGSVSKNIRIRERVSLQFQGEFINALNHPIFSGPTTNLSSTSFGQISGVQVSAREIQLRGYLRW
jgi:hypothetical protein